MRMSIAAPVLAALWLSGCTTPANTGEAESAMPSVDIAGEERAVRAVSAQWLELAQERDAAGIAGLFVDDGRLVWSSQDDLIVGPAAIQQAIANDFAENPTQTLDWTTERVDVAASGDLAVEYGSYVNTNSGADGTSQIRGNYVTVYRKVDGTWRVVADAGVDLPSR